MQDETSAQSISNDNSIAIQRPFTLDDPNISQEVVKELSSDNKSYNLLGNFLHNFKIDEQFILKLSKDNKNASNEVKNSCKVLHFPSEWSFAEVSATIDGLKPQEHPNLFIFIIQASNFEFIAKQQQDFSINLTNLQELLFKFGHTRPIILQLTSIDGNASKIYYKNENSFQFNVIEPQHLESDELDSFPSFLLSFVTSNFYDSEIEVLDAVQQFKKRSLILRFLLTLKLSAGFFGSLALDVATNGSKSEFIAALDALFISDGRILNDRAQKYIADVFGDDDDPQNDYSVFLRAVENENVEVIEYLLTYWTRLIQELPFEQQVKISTAALESNQLDVLSDLLNIADYPYPKEFKSDFVEHARLSLITAERTAFKAAMMSEDFEKLDEFLNNNPNLKFIYSPSNSSALTEAVNLKQFRVFYYLKSLDLKGEKCDDILNKISKEEKRHAIEFAANQRKLNVSKSQFVAPQPVMLLSMRSSTHNSRTKKPQSDKYREKIIKWLEDIHKVAPDLINVAATCGELKMIFDFESDTVENVSLAGSKAAGSTYPTRKWIFMGAKMSDDRGTETKEKDQEIKGVLAHELCHYVMRLVYENHENPYFKNREDVKERFEEIVKVINKWTSNEADSPDDECNGIISTVFTLYKPELFHLELIVRVVHILVQYDNNEAKSKHLHDKYKILFDFWKQQVIPDLAAFKIKCREVVRKMNRMLELLEDIQDELYNFKKPKDIKMLFDSQLTIVTTNVPMLLFNDIHNHLQDTTGDLFDTENIFVNPEVLENKEILEDFTKLLQEDPKLTIIVDCSSEIPGNINNLKGSKTVFVVSTDVQHDELIKIINNPEAPPTKIEINYNWSDLTIDSQELLLNHEVDFQDWTGMSLLELLMSETCFKEPKSSELYKTAKAQVLQDFPEIIDDELLNLLADGSEVCIDVQPENIKEQNMSIADLFIERDFIKKTQKEIKIQGTQELKYGLALSTDGQMMAIPNLSQEQMLFDVNDKTVVLISDIAGNGKSCVMKNFEDFFRQDESIKWVTYVDLKQFIDVFKSQKGEPEFSMFIAEHILKSKQQFEAKIFQKMYKDGRVVILFDGFDEIAPDCAEFVSKLAQNFQQNSGNQLWIATRDYFEIDLQQKLNTDAVYGLSVLSFNDAFQLIAESWLLMEMKFESFDEFNKYVTEPNDQYESYLQKAQEIVEKLFTDWLSPIGMPHMLTVVAECCKKDNDAVDFKLSIIFDKFMQRQYEKSTFEKGPIRKAANIQSQKFSMSFWRLHQYFAIALMFPKFLELLFPGCNASEWPVEEIIAFGLMTKFGDKLYFVHATYGEFFVADLVANGLKRPKIDETIIEIFIKILTNQQHVIIRRFLNDMIDMSILMKIQPNMKNIVDIFDDNSNFKFVNFFIETFIQNFENFQNFIIKAINCENYDRKKEILYESSLAIAVTSSDAKSFTNFQDYVFDTLTADDVADLIHKKGTLHCIILFNLSFEVFEIFLKKCESKMSRTMIRNELAMHGTFSYGRGNMLHHLSISPKFDVSAVLGMLKLYKNYFNFDEICIILSNCNEYKHSILMLYVLSRQGLFAKFWREIENFYSTNGSLEQFKELIKVEDIKECSLLHYSAINNDIKFHKDLWDLLLKTFTNRKELMDMILKIDQNDHFNFIHNFISNKLNAIAVEFNFKMLKETLTEAQYTAIISSKGPKTSNVLQTAAISSNSIEIHEILWKIIRESCKTDQEFLTILMDVDAAGRNILRLCAESNSSEIFEFFINELEKIASNEEIKKMLSHLDNNQVCLLQGLSMKNKDPKLLDTVWLVARKYFETSEIIRIIEDDCPFGENLLFLTFLLNDLKLAESTWNQIKKLFSYNEQVKYLKVKNKKGKNILERAADKKIGNDKIEWVTNLFREYKIVVQEQLLAE